MSQTQLIADWIGNSKSAIAFTGAGISTESGIPDFRSPGGVWSRTQPVYFQDFQNSAEARYEYWQQKAESHADFSAAQPNITHQALAKWESSGVLSGVITQNIDGLHQDAGSRNVLELHGTARDVSCLDCQWRDKADEWVDRFLQDDRVPDCPECNGRIKHATISFGQSLSTQILTEASRWSEQSDVFLAMGSSLVVEPAATLPVMAKRNGARLIIINREATPLDEIADLVVHRSLGETMTEILEQLESAKADDS